MALSIPLKAVAPAVRTASRWAFADDADWPQIRRRQLGLTRWPGAPRSVTVQTGALGGVPVEMSSQRTGDSRCAVLYLHGGGYTTGSPRTHRALTGRLAATMSATVYSVDYHLAPEHPYPAAVQDVVAAYRALLACGWDAQRVAVAGDSAGGALTLVCALRARAEDLPMPAVLGLICPASDVGAEAIAAIVDHGRDAVLTRRLIDRFVAGYGVGAGEIRAEHPDVSPARADLAGLPPMVIDSATDDLLVASARDLARRARAAGVTVRYREYPAWHGFHLLTGLVAAADAAVDEFAHTMVDLMPAQVEAR